MTIGAMTDLDAASRPVTPLAADAVGSMVNPRLVRRLHAEPALCDRRIDEELGDAEWLRASGVHISAWPVCVHRHLVETEFHALVAELPPVMYRALRVRFGTDGEAFARYFGWPRLVYDLLLRTPPDPAELVCRYDVVLRGGRAHVLELNCSSAAGGWQPDWAARAVARSLRSIADGGAWPVVHRRVFDQFLRHVFAAIDRLPARVPDSIALYAFVGEAYRESFRQSLQARYDALRPSSTGAGRIVLIDDMRQITFTQGAVLARGEPVGAVLLTFPDAVDIPQPVMDGLVGAHLRRRLVFPDSPTHAVLDSKLAFAVAHEAADRGLLDLVDMRVIRRFLPWTVYVGEARNRDDSALLSMLSERRDMLVLKRADSFGGRHVVVGRYADAPTWRQAIALAREEPGWIAQTRCESDALDLPRTGTGVMPHDVVWGVFGFGGRYGGTFARAAPQASSAGVVNAAGGAHEFLVFEELS